MIDLVLLLFLFEGHLVLVGIFVREITVGSSEFGVAGDLGKVAVGSLVDVDVAEDAEVVGETDGRRKDGKRKRESAFESSGQRGMKDEPPVKIRLLHRFGSLPFDSVGFMLLPLGGEKRKRRKSASE